MEEPFECRDSKAVTKDWAVLPIKVGEFTWSELVSRRFCFSLPPLQLFNASFGSAFELFRRCLACTLYPLALPASYPSSTSHHTLYTLAHLASLYSTRASP